MDDTTKQIDEGIIREALDRLHLRQVQKLDLETQRAARRAAVQATIENQLQAIDADYETDLEALGNRLDEDMKFVKTCVLFFGATVKGAGLMAVYAKGRMSWDGKRLDGYATAHPEILAFRSEGQPSVSIREV